MIANAEDPFLWQAPGTCPRHEQQQLRQLRRRSLGGQLALLPARLKAEIIDRLRLLLDSIHPLVRLAAAELILAISQRYAVLARIRLEVVKHIPEGEDREREPEPSRQRQPAAKRTAA